MKVRLTGFDGHDDRDGQEGLSGAVDAADDLRHHHKCNIAIISRLLPRSARESQHGLCALVRGNMDHRDVATDVGLFYHPRHGDRPAEFLLQQELSVPSAVL